MGKRRASDRAALRRDAQVVVEDGWQNFTTGMGDPMRDKLQGALYAPTCQLDWGQLDAMYYGDDMCERIVDALPDESFRRGYSLEGPQAEDATEALAAVDADTRQRDGFAWARLRGGCALVLGADDGQTPDKPLNIERVRELTFLNVVDCRYIVPTAYYTDPLKPKFGTPELYTVNPSAAETTTGVIVHESRLVLYYGTKVDPVTAKSLNGWSYSVLQRPYDVLRLFGSAFQAAGQLMNDAGQGVFEVQNLISQLAGPGKNAILQRFASLDMQRWAGRMLLVEKDKEGFHREPVQVSGVGEMLEHFEMRLAAAARMPVTMLMGRSPQGMNATGDSDMRLWNNSVRAVQTKELEPKLVRLLDVVTAGKWSADKDNKIIWTPLEEPNDLEDAQVAKLRAETWQIYSAQIGAVSGEQVALIEFLEQPITEVLDEEALQKIVEADTELALNPPPPPKVVVAPPGGKTLPPGANGQTGGQEPAAAAPQAPPRPGSV